MKKDKQILVITANEFNFLGCREQEKTSIIYKCKINVHFE